MRPPIIITAAASRVGGSPRFPWFPALARLDARRRAPPESGRHPRMRNHPGESTYRFTPDGWIPPRSNSVFAGQRTHEPSCGWLIDQREVSAARISQKRDGVAAAVQPIAGQFEPFCSSPAHRAHDLARLRHGSPGRRNGGTPASKVCAGPGRRPSDPRVRGQPGYYAVRRRCSRSRRRRMRQRGSHRQRRARRTPTKLATISRQDIGTRKTISDRRGFLKEHMEHQIRHRHRATRPRACRLCLANPSAPRAASPNADQPSTSEPLPGR